MPGYSAKKEEGERKRRRKAALSDETCGLFSFTVDGQVC